MRGCSLAAAGDYGAGKDRTMRFADLYTKAILTVIAALLAWNTLVPFRTPAVHAQSASSPYAVELVTAKWPSRRFQADLATAINNAAKGRELVAVLPWGAGKYLAVYKELSR